MELPELNGTLLQNEQRFSLSIPTAGWNEKGLKVLL